MLHIELVGLGLLLLLVVVKKGRLLLASLIRWILLIIAGLVPIS